MFHSIVGWYSLCKTFPCYKCYNLRKVRRSFAFWGDRMIQRTIAFTVVACVLFCISSGFADAQISSRKSSVNQSDAVLFQQAQKALRRANFAEARSLLNTLIDTHPDSDYVPRAKLSIADSWYSQHAFKQALAEYRDFVTFFPNRPEIAEVQRRISSIAKDTSF